MEERIDTLLKDDKPRVLDDLMEELFPNAKYSEMKKQEINIIEAVWNLIAKGKVDITKDRKFRRR